MNKTKLLMLGVVAFALMLTPLASMALSGVNAGDMEVKIFTKQGGDWFKAKTVNTNSNGALELKNALPGHYKGIIKDSDVQVPQYAAAKFRLLDDEGRKIDHKTDVDVYTVSGSTKTLALAGETDNEGWLTLAALFPGTDYFIDVKESSELSRKADRPRVKVSAKVEDSDWFRASYKRLSKEGILRISNVITGKYKFKYKSGDASPLQPFTLKATVLRNNGKEITKKTRVDLYAYMLGMRVKVAELKTDSDGHLTIPGVMTGMKYKIKVKD